MRCVCSRGYVLRPLCRNCSTTRPDHTASTNRYPCPAMPPANDSTRHYLTCTLAGGYATRRPYQEERVTTVLSPRRCRQRSLSRSRQLLGHGARVDVQRGHCGFALARWTWKLNNLFGHKRRREYWREHEVAMKNAASTIYC